MRRIGFCLCLAVLATALIGAAPAEQPTAPARPVTVLRGSQAAQNAKPAARPPAPLAPAASPVGDAAAAAADPGQCRTACDHSYYFCLAGQDSDSCPETWSSCRTGCNRAPIQP